MKKLIFALLFSLAIRAQTVPSYPTIKLTKTTLGTVADSLAVISNGTVKHLPTSVLKGVKQVTGTDGITVANGTTNPVIGISTISQLKVAGLVTDLGNKVDKVSGKSLISDSEITRLATLANYTHPTNHPPSIITQDPSNRFVTDAEKTSWNAKQNALGYTAENLVLKNAPNGYAGLGSDAKLLSSLLPDITISDTFVVSSQAAMLALNAQTGDVAVRTDLNKSFILKVNSPTVLASWQELLSPTSEVTSVNGRTGAVVVNKADVGLSNVDNTSDVNKPISTATQTALNGKAPLTGTGTSGTWPINISGNASSSSNSTLWNSYSNGFSAGLQGFASGINGIVGIRNSDNAVLTYTPSAISTFLGLGSNAYTSTSFLPLSGGTLTGALNGTMFNITTSDARFTGGNSVGRLLFGNSTTTAYAEFNGSTSASPDEINIISVGGRFRVFTNATERFAISNSGQANFSSKITVNSRATLATNSLYDPANNSGIAFGGDSVLSADGSGNLSPKSLGTATYPWGSATFASSVTAVRINGTDSSNWIGGNFGSTTSTDRVVLGNLSNEATIGGHNGALNAWASLSIQPGGSLTKIGGAVTVASSVTATAHITAGGTSSQYVKGDGSLSSTVPDSRPYKVYTAQIVQNGAVTPTITVMENTIGTISFSRTGIGVIVFTSSSLFTNNKTFISGLSGLTGLNIIATTFSSSDVGMNFVQTTTGSLADPFNSNKSFIEIRVYN